MSRSRPDRILGVALTVTLSGCTSILGLDLDRYRGARSDPDPALVDAGDSGEPLPSDGAASPVAPGDRRLAVGSDHVCAIAGPTRDDPAGGLHCLGSNAVGALGRGTLGGSAETFERVPLPAPATAVAAGDGVSCAVARDGLYCWGDVTFHSGGATPTPTLRGDGTFRWVTIADTGFHGCAGTRAGAVRCWGRNDSGELGTYQYDPAAPLFDVASVASGAIVGSAGLSFSCAVRSGTALCFGLNAIGQCGVETSVSQLNFWQAKPVAFAPPQVQVADVTAGSNFACARTIDGRVLCWGGHDAGQLGETATAKTKGMPIPYLSTPVAIGGLASPVRTVSAGATHACAVVADGSLYCWGSNSRGELARGAEVTSSDRPLIVEAAGRGIVAVDAQGHRTCILRDDEAVLCWGAGFGAQDDAGVRGDVRAPLRVGALPRP